MSEIAHDAVASGESLDVDVNEESVTGSEIFSDMLLSLIHISEPTRRS